MNIGRFTKHTNTFAHVSNWTGEEKNRGENENQKHCNIPSWIYVTKLILININGLLFIFI